LKFRDLWRLSYESQIRISLVFFILFLILLNFGTEYLFHKTKQDLRHQIHQQLSTTAVSAGLVWEKKMNQALKRNLMELAFESGVNRISFISLGGEPLISSPEIRSAEDLHIFEGIKPALVSLLRAKGDRLNLGEFFSDLYTDRSGVSYISCYHPLESPGGGRSVWVMVEKDVSALATIERMSRLNAWARMGGLLVAAIVTLLLVKNLLRPYRLMVKKAAKEKIVHSAEHAKSGGELDAAVYIFEQVINELKKKERILQELYQKTDRKAKNLASYNEYILKSITSGMIICDQEGQVTRINRQAEMILDKSEDALLGRHYETALGDRTQLGSIIRNVLQEQKPLSIPEISLAKDTGESIPLSLSCSAVKDEQGTMLGVVLFLIDLTERKRLEEEIAFKDKMATLGEMSSGLAHELRNSMGAILGFGKLIKKRKADPINQAQAVDGLVNEAMGMESMLQRFLAFAKPFQLNTEETDLKEVIQDCHRSLKEALREKHVAFEFDCQPRLPPIHGDRLLLKQCLQNLIQNSVQAMPGGGRLRIQLGEEQLRSGERSVTVEISDTGCGIAKEDQERVFNPFFTSREKGTGLGLSLVKKIISLHHGKIELESQPNKGTTFRIHLPLRPQLEPAPTAPEGKHDLEPIITGRAINVGDGNNVG
jgi:PAS domain S-box-containing protein